MPCGGVLQEYGVGGSVLGGLQSLYKWSRSLARMVSKIIAWKESPRKVSQDSCCRCQSEISRTTITSAAEQSE
ncbi:hypothetical protein CHARACLAT_008795 [Characodon lateralis]|uniref:Uncharacterized protein n=1 Tax=Characodon lateralis TaxID=208331 RepID=A0ABU7EUK8_9TELE|nr:hypothetical protein [Characodon lateralis]